MSRPARATPNRDDRDGGGDDPSELADPSEVLAPFVDGAEDAVLRGGDPAEVLRMNQQLLRYVHDSHLKLAKVLERSDRSEMVVQSTEALNRTFRRLHESQEELASQLARERRRQPIMVGLSVVVGGFLAAAMIYFLFDALAGDLRSEALAISSAREDLAVAAADSGRELGRSGALLVEAIDRGFAANRVLANENRAVKSELDQLKRSVSELESGAGQLQQERDAARIQAEKDRAEADRLVIELDRVRSELIDRDVKATDLKAFVDSKRGVSPAAVIDEGESANSTQPNNLSANPPVPAPALSSPEPSAPKMPVEAPSPQPKNESSLPTLNRAALAVNRFLMDAGVQGLRLIRSGEIVDGGLAAPFFEIRESGYPIGAHDAARLVIEVDPVTRRAELVLSHGSTLRRGARTLFGEDGLRIPIELVVNDAWLDPVLTRMVLIRPTVDQTSSPASAEANLDGIDLTSLNLPVPTPAKSFDDREGVKLLNRALEGDGYEEYEFFQIGSLVGVDKTTVRLTDVRLHLYQGGNLRGTTTAKSCVIHVDQERRTIGLRFLDGTHTKGGREIPFFKGSGDEVGTWSLELSRADVSKWIRLLERLSTMGSKP